MADNTNSLFGSSLYSPELKSDHPVTITAALDVSDDNPMTIAESVPMDAMDDLGTIKVGVSTWKATEAYDIAWPKVKGAVSYRLRASMSPNKVGDIIQDNLPNPITRFFPPYFSEVVSYFFWIEAVSGSGVATLLTDVPASLMSTAEKEAFEKGKITDDPVFWPAAEELNQELARDFEYVRKGNRLELEIGGEPAFLYLRRHGEDRPWSIPCSCTRSLEADDSDPDYNGVGRCKLCFGTGVFGGFLPKIKIAILKDGSAASQMFTWGKRGMTLSHVFNTAMLWTPVVRVGDLVVRKSDGSRYEVTKTNPDISARAVRFSQAFDLEQVKKTSILMEVTDKAIERSLLQARLPGFLREGYKIFS